MVKAYCLGYVIISANDYIPVHGFYFKNVPTLAGIDIPKFKMGLMFWEDPV
jgi:hypothetical protein